MKILIAAQARCGGWEPVETAGTADEQNNPIKVFNSTWLEVQKFYVSRAEGSGS